jgi:regulator of replication initiation timing
LENRMSDLDRRDLLEAALDAAEEGTLEAPIEKEIDTPTDAIAEESAKEEVISKDHEESSQEPEPIEFASKDEAQEAAEEVKPVSRPSTWKKEYVTIWDKMEKGEQISKDDFTKFAEYANQRESEYKKGVSTYKAEADRARELENAIAPFQQEFAQQGITPAAWINNLGRAHMILSKADPAQKIQVFQRLAQDYGIQLNGEGQFVQPQVDAYTQQLMNQLNQVNQEVSSIKGRFAQEENQRLMSEIERVRSDVEKFPHFDVVREEMAQLLELGKAQNLETAYKKAVRMNDDVWALEQDRLLKDAKQAAIKSQQVAKAKAAAVSPKSATPSGKVSDTGDKKDRRSLIAEQLGSAMSGRL